MAAVLSSFNMGSMFGLLFGDETALKLLYCLWSKAPIFETALTKKCCAWAQALGLAGRGRGWWHHSLAACVCLVGGAQSVRLHPNSSSPVVWLQTSCLGADFIQTFLSHPWDVNAGLTPLFKHCSYLTNCYYQHVRRLQIYKAETKSEWGKMLNNSFIHRTTCNTKIGLAVKSP